MACGNCVILTVALFCLLTVDMVDASEREIVRTAGATLPQEVYEHWDSAYIAENSKTLVTYQPTGSGVGLNLILEGEEVVFVSSNSVVTEEEYAQVPDLQVLPILIGGIAVLARSYEGMVLTREVLADIFIGDIEFWDDPRITELNPSINFQHFPIIVIYREHRSGTTEEFTMALSKFSESWERQFQHSDVWPQELREQTHKYIPQVGNEGVFTMASLTPFSITYVSYSFVKHANYDSFAIKLFNKAGNLVSCNVHSVAAAVDRDPGSSFDISDSPNEYAWPIAGYTYIVIRKESTKPELCDEFWLGVDFLAYALNNFIPNLLVTRNGFVSITHQNHYEVLDTMGELKCNGESRFDNNRPPPIAPIPTQFYYEPLSGLSDFKTISTISYSPFYNEIGSTIPSSEADELELSTISSLYSSSINFNRYYDDISSSSAASSISIPTCLATFCLFGLLYLNGGHKFTTVLLFSVVCFSVSAQSQELRVAGLYPITGDLSVHGAAAEAAVRIAVNDLNEEYAKNHNIAVVYDAFDTSSQPSFALGALDNARDEFNMFGIIGCHDDLTSSSVALIATYYQFPQLSYASRANYLSNSDEYPFFARVVPPYSAEGKSLALLVNTYGWKKVGVILTADDYGDGASAEFRSHMPEDSEVTVVQFSPGEENLDSQMSVLRNSLVRVIIMFPGSVEDARTILSEAYRYHLTGDEFVWMGGSFVANSELYYDHHNGNTNQFIKRIAKGMIAVKLRGGFGERYEEFLSRWETLDPSLYSGSGKRFMSEFAPYAYDAMELFVRTFIERKFDSFSEFIGSMRNITFDGLTGEISLNGNGDRHAIFRVVNLRDITGGDQGFVNIGTWTEEKVELDDTKTFNKFGFEFDHRIHFHDGSTEPPSVDVRREVEYWSCTDKKMKVDRTGKIRLDPPGPNAENIAAFYHCDWFMDCGNFSDESFECTESNYTLVFIIFGVFAGILILVTVILILFVIMFGFLKKRARVRSASPPFLLIVLFSMILGYASIFAWFGQPNSVACAFQPWLLGLAINAMISALVAKNARIYKIFNAPLKRKEISDLKVLVAWFVMVVPAVFLLALWTLISTPTATLKEIEEEKHFVCDTGGFTGPPGGLIFFSIFVAYTGIILLIGAIVSFLTRKVPSFFNESRLIAISIYNLVFLGVIIIPVFFVLQEFNPFVGWIIRTVAILYGFSATLCLLFVPKVWGLIRDKGKDPKILNTSRIRSGNRTDSSSITAQISTSSRL